MSDENGKIGNPIIYLSLSLTILLWILSKNSISDIASWPLLSISQIAALLGTILFVWSMLLATRLNFLENWFGGLDNVYKVHRKVSIIGAIFILIHLVFLISDNAGGWWRYILPFHNQNSVNLGIYAFWIFVVVILSALFVRKINLKYHVWKNIHKFVNLAMILTLLHVMMIESDTSAFLPLGIWIYWMTGFGVACGLYISFFYKYIGPKYKYEVVDIDKHVDVYNIFLKPLGDKIPFSLAQFAYVSFQSSEISSELHPYCIVSLPEESVLRFSIKELGDYTKTLNKLKVGDKAMVYGPYGRLGFKFTTTMKDAIFIAGGIGIAPFLSMFRKAGLEKNNRRTSLFYCTKYREEATFDLELKELKQNSPNLYYHSQCSREPNGGHLSVQEIMERIRDTQNTIIYLCGPKKMMVGIKEGLMKKKIQSQNIVLEDFEML
jgi:predicted ferric reductase